MISCLAALFFINILLLCADAVLPIYINNKYPNSIGETQIALIFA